MNKSDIKEDIPCPAAISKKTTEGKSVNNVVQTNLDKILAVLSTNITNSSDINELIDVLKKETEYIDSIITLRENGIYILVSNYISLCPTKTKELFFHNLIMRAPELPFAAIGLIDDEKITFVPGIEDIPTIKSAMDIINTKTYLRRTGKIRG